LREEGQCSVRASYGWRGMEVEGSEREKSHRKKGRGLIKKSLKFRGRLGPKKRENVFRA